MEKHIQKGFTLAELLVVISILGLLTSIVLVSTSGATERARIAKILQWSQSLHSLLGADVVGIWRMDENPAIHNTVITDYSGKGNNGTLITNDGSTNKAAVGVVGGALSFDGADDYVSVSNAAALNPTAAISVEIWLKILAYPPAATYWATPLYKGGNGQYYFRLGNDGSFAWIPSYDSFGKILSTPSPIPLNTWQHIVGTYDGANIRLFQNGTQVDSEAQTGTLLTSTVALGFGSYIGGWYFNGLIDEVRIYNRALSAFEIQKHYAEGLEKYRELAIK